MRCSVYSGSQISVFEPNSLLYSEREVTLDELNGLLQENIGSRCEQGMEVVWHEDELVELVLVLGTMTLQCIHEQICHGLGAENRTATPWGGSNKKCTDLLRCVRHFSLTRAESPSYLWGVEFTTLKRGASTLRKNLIRWGGEREQNGRTPTLAQKKDECGAKSRTYPKDKMRDNRPTVSEQRLHARPARQPK